MQTEQYFECVHCRSLGFTYQTFGFPCSSDKRIANLEETVRILHTELADSRQTTDSLHKALCVHRLRHQCETLHVNGHVVDAARLLLEIGRTTNDDVKADITTTDWLSGEFHYHRWDETV